MVKPLTPAALAVMVVVPGPTLVAEPPEEIVATEVTEEFQLSAPVVARLRVLPSTKVPIALKLAFVPLAMTGLPGVTAIDRRLDKSTVIEAASLVTPRKLTVTLTGPPTVLPIARPLLAVMNTMLGCDEIQLTHALGLQTLVMS